MPICHWPKADRPRERLIKSGPQVLSDAELLAVFLRTGLPGKNAIDHGREIIQYFGSLKALFAASLGDFSAIKGLGTAKYAQLQAVIELARRVFSEELSLGISLDSPQTVKDYLRLRLGNMGHEVFLVMFLDVQNRLIATEELFRGSLTQSSVHPREIVKMALMKNAAALILAHNHPGGSPKPSQADQQLTLLLKQTLALVEVLILDHFIIGGHLVYSFVENRLL